MPKTDLVVRDAVDTFAERLYMVGRFFFSFVALAFGVRCCYLIQRENLGEVSTLPEERETDREGGGGRIKTFYINWRRPSANLLLTTNALEFQEIAQDTRLRGLSPQVS